MKKLFPILLLALGAWSVSFCTTTTDGETTAATETPSPSLTPTFALFNPPSISPDTFDANQGELRLFSTTFTDLDLQQAGLCCLDPDTAITIAAAAVPDSSTLNILAWLAPDAPDTVTWGVEDPGGQAVATLNVAPTAAYDALVVDTASSVSVTDAGVYKTFEFAPATAGNAYWASVTPTGNAAHIPSLYLIGADGLNILADNGNSVARSVEIGVPVVGVGGIPTATDPMWIAAGDANWMGDADYTHDITVREVDLSAAAAFDETGEPNDDLAGRMDPGVVPAGTGLVLTGNIANSSGDWGSSDSDAYQFSTDADAEVLVYMEWNTGADVDLFVYTDGVEPDPDTAFNAPDNATFWTNVAGYSISTDDSETVSFFAPMNADFTIEVVGWDGGASDYTVTVVAFPR